jgi:hypothetical protein
MIKYAVNGVLALGVTVLLLVAARRVTQPGSTPPSDGVGTPQVHPGTVRRDGS